MGFFGTLFGTDKKFNMIRTLLKERLNESGSISFDTLNNHSLLRTPEGIIITIVEDAIRRVKRGQFTAYAIRDIEALRKQSGKTNSEDLQWILDALQEQKITPDQAICMYCDYRVQLEFPGVVNQDHTIRVFQEAVILME